MMSKHRLSIGLSYTFCIWTTQSIHAHGMKAYPFRLGWDSSHYVPLMWPYHLQLLRKMRLMSSPKLTELTTSLNAFNTSTRRSMTYWTDPMLSTNNAMISIRCHTSSRWATKLGYTCRRSALTGPHRKIHPRWYGPYTITNNIGDNDFKLNIPPFLGLHPMFNIDSLRPYFSPLLNTSDIAKQLTLT